MDEIIRHVLNLVISVICDIIRCSIIIKPKKVCLHQNKQSCCTLLAIDITFYDRDDYRMELQLFPFFSGKRWWMSQLGGGGAPNKGKTDRTGRGRRQWFLHARTTPVWSIRLDDQALRSYVHSPCLLFCPLYCCAWGATELMVLIHLPDAASPSGRRSLLGSDLMDDLSSSKKHSVRSARDSEGIIRSRCCHTCRLYTNVKGIHRKEGSSLGYRYGTLVSPPFSI